MTSPETSPDTTPETSVEANPDTTLEAMTQAEGFYKAYEEHSRTLRAWLVAYGIGGPVLMLTNDHISLTLSGSGHARTIAILFLGGVVLQVLLTAVNKTAMWICYFTLAEED